MWDMLLCLVVTTHGHYEKHEFYRFVVRKGDNGAF